MNNLISLHKLRFKRLAVAMIVTLLRDRRFAFDWFECCALRPGAIATRYQGT
jgi:hypothetical protein